MLQVHSLVVCEHRGGQLAKGTLSAVSAALELSNDVMLMVAGSGVGHVTQASRGIIGVSKVSRKQGIGLMHADQSCKP